MSRVIVDRPSLRILEDGGIVHVEAPEDVRRAMADAHTRIASPYVPAVRVDGDRLILECDARADLGGVLGQLSRTGPPITYGEAVAFNEFLMDAVEAGHRAGLLLGAMDGSSVLAGASGRLYLIGFGLPAAARPDATTPGAVVAPELILGLALSEASDVFVLHALLRNLLPFASLPDSYRAALSESGRTSSLHDKLVALSATLLAPDPARRPQSIDALRRSYREIRPLVPDMPEADREAMRARIQEGVRALAPRSRLRVDRHGRSLLVEDTSVDLSRRGLLWRLTERLVDAHREGRAVSADELVEAGWPDETMSAASAKTRLYTAIRDLRKAGLGEHLVSRDGGYFLSHDLELIER